MLFGAAGVIDGLAAFYPKTVTHLMTLAGKRPLTQDTLDEINTLQYVVSKAEEFVVKGGIIGIKEGVFHVTGFGTLEGGRLPLRGRLPDGDWERLRKEYLADIDKVEVSLE